MVIVGACAVVVALTIAARGVQRWREGLAYKRRRRELREGRTFLEKRQAQRDRLATRIIATSSTNTIAGFTIVRQIEAVFTDGHAAQSQAVQALKAEAAEMGANALINLISERPPSGKCVARGDAVIVRPIEQNAPHAEPDETLPNATDSASDAESADDA